MHKKITDIQFDVIIPVCFDDLETCKYVLPYIQKHLRPRNVIIIGNSDVGEALKEWSKEILFLDEASLIKLSDVRIEIASLEQEGVDRAGWYYQQFLKMQYAFSCKDEYYFIWDSDTIPIKQMKMFKNGHPIFDMKTECHAPYFVTMKRLIDGLTKMEERSFISEHMLIKTSYMRELVDEISKRTHVGQCEFWKGILRAIDSSEISKSGFSEFETYGNWCQMRHGGEYVLRNYTSLRDGALYFRINALSERDLRKLSSEYDAISFEKSDLQLENQGMENNFMLRYTILSRLKRRIRERLQKLKK